MDLDDDELKATRELNKNIRYEINKSKTEAATKKRLEMNEEDNKKKAKINNAKQDLMQQYNQNLPELIEKRLQEMSQELAKSKEVKGISTLEINELLRPRKYIAGGKMKYTAEQLDILFDYYRKALVMINKKIKFPPTKENFCAFAGISSTDYRQYMQGNDEDKAQVMQKIDDYIVDNMLTAAQLGDTKEITPIFRAKASHGLVEAAAPQEHVFRTEVDISKVNQLIDTLKQGKSLKTIDVDSTEKD